MGEYTTTGLFATTRLGVMAAFAGAARCIRRVVAMVRGTVPEATSSSMSTTPALSMVLSAVTWSQPKTLHTTISAQKRVVEATEERATEGATPAMERDGSRARREAHCRRPLSTLSNGRETSHRKADTTAPPMS